MPCRAPVPTNPTRRALALAHYGWLEANGPDIKVALDATGEALDLLAAVDDPWVESWVLTTRILVAFFSGRLDEARALVPGSPRTPPERADRWSQAITTLIGAELDGFDGDSAAARAATDEAIRNVRGARRRLQPGDHADPGGRPRRGTR